MWSALSTTRSCSARPRSISLLSLSLSLPFISPPLLLHPIPPPSTPSVHLSIHPSVVLSLSFLSPAPHASLSSLSPCSPLGVDEVGLGEQGINLPGTPIDLPALTEKDKKDLVFGVQQGVDLIAASFIRKADDVKDIRKVASRRSVRVCVGGVLVRVTQVSALNLLCYVLDCVSASVLSFECADASIVHTSALYAASMPDTA
eukprot:2515532-Rhodomonas_salina.2